MPPPIVMSEHGEEWRQPRQMLFGGRIVSLEERPLPHYVQYVSQHVFSSSGDNPCFKTRGGVCSIFSAKD